jgi:hypothetical protein
MPVLYLNCFRARGAYKRGLAQKTAVVKNRQDLK